MNSIKKITKSNKNTLLLIFISFFIFISLTFKLSGMSGNDFWWHLRSGEWIVKHKKIPTSALFTWYGESQNLNWFAHEWLTEVFFYYLYSFFGSVGMYLFCAFLGVLIISLTIIYNRNYYFNNLTFSIIYTFYFALIITQFFYGRPHLFNMLFMYYLLYVLYKYKDHDTKLIYSIPILSVVWVNFHGGSSNLIYILPLCFIISGLINFEYGKLKCYKAKKNKILTLIVITIISFFALCINPRGFSMVTYPFTNMKDDMMLKVLSEWASPDAKDLSVLILCFIPVILVTIVLISTQTKIDVCDFLIYGFFTYMFFRSQRFISLFMIATSFFIFKYVAPFKKKQKNDSVNEKQNQLVLFFTSVILISFVTMFCVNTINHPKNKKLISFDVSDEYIELIKSENPKRLFNEYNYGGALIYKGIDVFVDGRADIYTGDTLKNYQSLKHCRNYNKKKFSNDTYMDDLIKLYDFDAYFVDPTCPLYNYLITKPDKYKLIKSNKKFAYFKVLE